MKLACKSKDKEPVWAKYITEDNLPTEDLQFLCSIIGLEATKKLMIHASGEKFSINAHCNKAYKEQYILDNYDGTKKTLNEIVVNCDITIRYAYQVIKDFVEGKKKK